MLHIWEAGLAGEPASRAERMLRAGNVCGEAGPDDEIETLSSLSIGRRDMLVLDLRTRLFGPWIEAVLSCPACDTELETGFAAAAVRVAVPEAPAELEVRTAGHAVRFRLPRTGDLGEIAAMGGEGGDPAATRAALLGRCVLDARDSAGTEVPARDLPGEVVAAIAAAMEEADPGAAVRLAVTCTSCGHSAVVPFDAVEFLWQELEAAANRLLADVHRLATAYGWPEREILALSPVRRERYLAMVPS